MVYVSDDNLSFCKEHYAELYARTNSAVAAAANAQLEEGFSYSKDAHMMQCPAGYLAMRVEKRNAANGNIYYNYCFSFKKCKAYSMRDNCKVGKSKCHTILECFIFYSTMENRTPSISSISCSLLAVIRLETVIYRPMLFCTLLLGETVSISASGSMLL